MSKSKENKRDENVARVIIEAEFEIDSVSLTDALMTVQNAVEELQAYGYVTKARVHVPETEMDLMS